MRSTAAVVAAVAVLCAASALVSAQVVTSGYCGFQSSSSGLGTTTMCAIPLASGQRLQVTNCPVIMSSASYSGDPAFTIISPSGSQNSYDDTASGYGSCGARSTYSFSQYFTSGTYTIQGYCAVAPCSQTVYYRIYDGQDSCQSTISCSGCASSSLCGWCGSSTYDGYCLSRTSSLNCGSSFASSVGTCPGSSNTINSGGSGGSSVPTGVKVQDMPGSAAPIAGFIIGILFTIIFFAVIYYYQTRDQRLQKEAQVLQAKQLAEATKKAADAQSPNTKANLQAAVAAQAVVQPAPVMGVSQGGAQVVSPNMIVVQQQPASPVHMGQPPVPGGQVVMMTPQPGAAPMMMPVAQPMGQPMGQPMMQPMQPQGGMTFQPMQAQPMMQPGMQFQPQPMMGQPLAGQPMQFQPQPQQGMQFQPQPQPGMQFQPQPMQFQPQQGMQFQPAPQQGMQFQPQPQGGMVFQPAPPRA